MLRSKLGLIIIVVLALSSLVEGGFQIGTRYLDDRPFDPDTDVLSLDESLYLSCYTDETVGGHMGQYIWALVCEASLASITGGEAGPDAYGVEFSGSASDLWSIPGSVPEDEDGQYGSFYSDPEGAPGCVLYPGLYLDKFLYNPLSVGDVTVRFLELSSSGGEIISVPDSVVIRQIPEPMTVILVALGGLFVLRRK